MTTQTILIIISSSFTAVVSTSMMFVVFLRAPKNRVNQLFGGLMLCLGIFGASNVLSRLIDQDDLNPEILFSFNSMMYVYALMFLYFFSAQFTATDNLTLDFITVIFAGVYTLGIFSGNIFSDIRPSEVDVEGYVLEYTSLGSFLILFGAAYLFYIVLRLRRNPDPRPQAIYPGGAVMVFGVAMLALRPFSNNTDGLLALVLTFPYNSLSLGIAAAILGYAVLRVQLFDPLRKLNDELLEVNHQLAEANRLKDQFLANVSHELRTPLNAIIGYTDLMKSGVYGAVNEKQSERLSKVAQNSRALLALINDVLDLSKIAAGEMKIFPADMQAHEAVQAAVSAVESLATEKGLALVTKLPETPIEMVADKDRIRQILVNLLGNAIKFTEAGQVTLSVRPSDGERVRFEVRDTGIGIPPDDLRHIFAEFRQVDGSSTRQHEGTGLGLAICQQFVEMHGGQIGVESTLGKGSTFYFEMPTVVTIETLSPAERLDAATPPPA